MPRIIFSIFLLATVATVDVHAAGMLTETFIDQVREQTGDATDGVITVDDISLSVNGRVLSVRLSVSSSQQFNLFSDPVVSDELTRFLFTALADSPVPFRGLYISVRDPDTGIYRSLEGLRPELPPVPKKPWESDDDAVLPRSTSLDPEQTGRYDGLLNGRTVFLSPGHGWTYSGGSWITQRGNTHGIVEDISNAEIVSYFFSAYLRNAGAFVIPVRETARNSSMVIVDNIDTAGAAGTYEERGNWQDSAGSENGYGHTDMPYAAEENPFTLGSYRYAVSADDTWARWIPDIPADGRYHVFVTYRAMADRAPDAVYTVNHAGGSTDVTVNTRHHGSTWVDLGAFYFRTGSDSDTGSVVLTAKSHQDTDAIFIADAVRFGGGTGVYDRGGGVSGMPRYEECSRYHAMFAGAPASVYNPSSSDDRSDDVSARSRFAAWENEETYDDSLYVSWHSNAFNGTSRGLSTYVYGHNDPGTGWEPAAVAGSEDLASFIHAQLLQTIRDAYSTEYEETGYGLYSAWFGELNPSNNDEMPSCLIELAFHDNEADAQFLKDPKFRDLAARAAYMGIVQYFSDRDGTEPTYLPSPPRNVAAVRQGANRVIVSWDAPFFEPVHVYGDEADEYIVQKSTDGKAFDAGITVMGTSVTIDGLTAETPYYFRVVAKNDGGRSFPSAVVAAVPSAKRSQVLILDGFSRLDAHLMVDQDLSSHGLSTVKRMFLDHMNAFDYVIPHADSLFPTGLGFDSAGSGALESIDLSAYDMVVWFAGEQSTADETFTSDQQTDICSYISDGGAFFVSGAEIGWDLVEEGSVDDAAFYEECLSLEYGGDDADTYHVTGAGAFFDLSFTFDDGTLIYNVDYPDIVLPMTDEGTVMLRYDNTGADPAAVIITDGKRVAALGFPFETITDGSVRRDIMDGVVDAFAVVPAEYPDDDVMPDEDGMADDDTAVPDMDMYPDGETHEGAVLPDTDETVVSDDDNDQIGEVGDNDDVRDDSELHHDADVPIEQGGDSGGCGCSVVI